MIRPDQIPDEVAAAARKAMLAGWSDVHEIIAAAINAWPGAIERPASSYVSGLRDVVILPLPAEPSDE